MLKTYSFFNQYRFYDVFLRVWYSIKPLIKHKGLEWNTIFESIFLFFCNLLELRSTYILVRRLARCVSELSRSNRTKYYK